MKVKSKVSTKHILRTVIYKLPQVSYRAFSGFAKEKGITFADYSRFCLLLGLMHMKGWTAAQVKSTVQGLNLYMQNEQLETTRSALEYADSLAASAQSALHGVAGDN